MTKTIWVTKAAFEKNATDGIDYFTDKNKLAEHVHECESMGARVQVFKCVPVNHEVYVERASISLEGEEE